MTSQDSNVIIMVSQGAKFHFSPQNLKAILLCRNYMIARKNQGVNLGFLFVLDSFALGRVSWAPLAALGASLASETDSLSRLSVLVTSAQASATTWRWGLGRRSAFGLCPARSSRRSALAAPSLVPVPGALRPARPRVAPGFSGLRALACSCAVPARAPEAFGSGVPSLLACGGLSLGRSAPGARRGAFVAPRRFPTSPLVVLLSQRLHKRARLNCTGFARPCLLLSL